MELFQQKFDVLKSLIETEGSFDVKRAASLIADLKIALVDALYLTNQESTLSITERVNFRTLLEYDAIVSIKTRAISDFSRAMTQLRIYYFNSPELPTSERMPLLVSINLIHLLSINESSEFQIEYQHAKDIIKDNKYLSYVTEVYRLLADNSFSTLFTLVASPPSELFNHFTTDLLNNIRNNHADSIEKSYEKLHINQIQKLMHFNSNEDVQIFASKRGWKFDDNGYVTFFVNNGEGKTKLTEKAVERFVDLAIQISSFA